MKRNDARRTIAVTVWGQRVSPVFDSARTLLIVEIDGGTMGNVSSLAFDSDRPLELLQMLRAQQVTVVICGAVSEEPAAMLEAAGVEVIPFIAGDVGQVLERYCQGQPLGPEFRMPGCGRGICCRGKIRRGREIGGRQMRRHQEQAMAGCESKERTAGGGDIPDQSGNSWPPPLNRSRKDL